MKTKPDRSLLICPIVTGAGRRPSAFWIGFLRGISVLSALSFPLGHAAQSVTLAWDANPEPNIAGYVVRYGTTRAKPNQSIPVVKKTTATVSNLADNTTYYFTVAVRNTLGLESLPSNEVSYTTPPLGSHKLTVINGTGSGSYTEGTLVPVSANQPKEGQQFERWIGDYQILLDPPTTKGTRALMLFRDLKIEASYNAASASDKIRYIRGQGFAARMVGGVFEGTNGNPMTGTYTPIYTIFVPAPGGMVGGQCEPGEFPLPALSGTRRFIRKCGGDRILSQGSQGKGTGYGTPGSWNGNGNTLRMALDGDVHTRFDGPHPHGVYVGIDTASLATDPLARK